MEKIEFGKKLPEIEHDINYMNLKFTLLDHSDEEENFLTSKKEIEPFRIIFIGANNSYKSSIVSKIINSADDKNTVRNFDRETCLKYSLQLEVEPTCDLEVLKYQDCEIYDCTGSSYYKMISKIEKKLKIKNEEEINSSKSLNLINLLNLQAQNFIIEYFDQIITCFNLKLSQFDIYVITFDNLLSWTIEEAKL